MADPAFPCSLTIDIPLPTPRLATSALRALSVDAELSSLVCREFSLVAPSLHSGQAQGSEAPGQREGQEAHDKTILRTTYAATTNRMLRVAVNGFMESLGVVLRIMEELDGDIVEAQR